MSGGPRRSAGYRPDIDGLRAIAVAGVLVFHAFPELLPGGYVGVDVFFVISGFLITQIVRGQTVEGRFSISEFYERRIRRIFPALVVVVLATSLVALALLPPEDLKAYGRSLAPSIGFGANFHFWTRGSYFNPPQDVRPLLHLWSLGVEEQFYLVWPALLILSRRASPRGLTLILLLLITASLTADQIWLSKDVLAAFYFTPLRAWEPLIGALLAAGWIAPSRSAWVRQGLGLAGLAVILGSMALLRPDTPFPGLAALPACLGAALVLQAGRGGSSAHSLAGQLLSSAPLVALGTASYSLYLWHWPVLTFLRLGLADEPPAWVMVLGLVLSLVLALVSLRWVERPYRRRPLGGLSRGQLFAVTFGGIALIALSGSGLAADEGLRGRAHGVAVEAMAAEHDRSALWNLCHDKKIPKLGACDFGAPGPGPTQVLVWGDSLAAAWAPAVADWSAAHGLRGHLSTMGACLPSLGIDVHEKEGSVTSCRAHNQAMLDLVKASPHLKTLFLIARWPIYETGSGPVEGVWFYLTHPGAPRDPTQFHALTAEGVERLVDALERAGPPGLSIVILGPSPEFPVNPDRCAQRASFMHRDPGPCLNSPAAPILARQSGSLAILHAVAARHPNITLLNPDAVFCDAQACHVRVGGRIGFIDGDHLTGPAARALGPALLSRAPVP